MFLESYARVAQKPAAPKVVGTWADTPSGTYDGIGGSDARSAIIFTANQTGSITSIKVNATANSMSGFTAELWTMSGGSPNTQVGGASSDPGSGTGDMTLTWASPPAVISGDDYAISFDRSGGSGALTLTAVVDNADYQCWYNATAYNDPTSLTSSDAISGGRDSKFELTYT